MHVGKLTGHVVVVGAALFPSLEKVVEALELLAEMKVMPRWMWWSTVMGVGCPRGREREIASGLLRFVERERRNPREMKFKFL